jgi:hypothetical protein
MVQRYTYIKPVVAFAKAGIKDNVTGEIYDFTVDTILDEMNNLNSMYDRQKQLAKIRRNEIISRVDFFNECFTSKDISSEVKDFLTPLTQSSFEIKDYIRKDDVLNILDEYINDDFDSELVLDIYKKISRLK